MTDASHPAKKALTKGLPIILSAPSGAGKSTVAELVAKALPNTILSVSCTTRAPRPGEENGKHYFFISEPDFKSKIKTGEFLEWAEVHGKYYGTPRQHLEDNINRGLNVILTIDVQGALSIKRFYPQGVYIFLVPPSWEVLEQRLKLRASDDGQSVKLRMTNARKELSFLSHYDYLVVNDELDKAVKDVSVIMQAEHLRQIHIDKSRIKILA